MSKLPERAADASVTEAPDSVTPKAVKQLVHEVWPNLKPHDATCSDIAGMIRSLHVMKAPKQKKIPILGKAEKHGRLFLRHLEASRKRLEDRRQQPAAKAILADMDAATQHIRAVIEGCNSIPIDGAYMDLAPVVADYAKRALRLSPINVPKSVNAEDPLCQFMVGVFHLIGIRVAGGTMSDMLRGRYHRRRSGKSKKAGAKRSRMRPL
jgi:hypothetical protein